MPANPPALTAIRKRSGHSIRSLAAAAGIAPSTLKRIEDGTHGGHPATLQAIATALNVDVAAITHAGVAA